MVQVLSVSRPARLCMPVAASQTNACSIGFMAVPLPPGSVPRSTGVWAGSLFPHDCPAAEGAVANPGDLSQIVQAIGLTASVVRECAEVDNRMGLVVIPKRRMLSNH